MDSGNGRKPDAQQETTKGVNGRKRPNASVGAKSSTSSSGTDVDTAILLARAVHLRGSLTTADRPRPATGIERGSNVGSHSHHFVGSRKQAAYADSGYVRPHHSRADVNISQQAINTEIDDEHMPKGDLSTVESSKSDTELLSTQEAEVVQDDSVTRLSGLLVNAVTLASAGEMLHQSKSSNPTFVSHLNKCNSSSKTYESGLADLDVSPEAKGHRSNGDITTHRSAYSIEDERGAGLTEGKRSSHSMLGRIKVLTSCLSSSDEGWSREDMTASSEDSSAKRRLSSKITKKKMKKKKKENGGEDVEKRNAEEKSSSESEVGIKIIEATALEMVDEAAVEKEVEKKPKDAVVEATDHMEISRGPEISEKELPELTPPDVLKEIKQKGDKEAPSSPQSDRVNEQAQCHEKMVVAPQHSGSSIELLHDDNKDVEGGEQVLSAIVTPGKTSLTIAKPAISGETKTPSKRSLQRGSDTNQVHVTHHGSAPVQVLKQADEEDMKSQPEIALKAVKERYRVLSEQISDAIPGVSIDEKVRLAVLGSLSYAAKSGDRPETGRRVASAPGPLENMAQHLAEEFAQEQAESGIASFEGTYCDESSNHYHGSIKGKKDSRSSSDSAKDLSTSAQDRSADVTTSSDSSQDDYIQKMRAAQRLINSHHKTTPTPQQLPSMVVNVDGNTKAAGDLLDSVYDPGLMLIRNDDDRDIKKGNLGDISPSTVSSGYGSAFQAKLADLEANLNMSVGLGKPYKVDVPIEEDSMRKKELGYILKMLEKEGGGQGPDSHRDPALLESAVNYLYWSRHDAQDLLRKPQQHQKVVIEDQLEAQNLQLDLPPYSAVKGSETLERLKAELEHKLKHVEDAISQNQESEAAQVAADLAKTEPRPKTLEDIRSSLTAQEVRKDGTVQPPISKPVNLALPNTDTQYSSSSSSTEDSRPPSSFHYNRSVALMSPGGALGSSVLLEECESARRVRREMEERIAELERGKEEMAAQMKERRLTSVQLEAHLFSQLTTLTQEYQNLMAHDQEHKQLSKELKLQLDRKQKELEEALTHTTQEGTDSQQLQDKLDAVTFESKEKIHQLIVQLTLAQQEKARLQKSLQQEAVRQEAVRENAKKRAEEARREKDTLIEELNQERNNRTQLDAELLSHARDLHQLAASLQDLQVENRSQAGEVRRLHGALEQSIQDRAELQQELKEAQQRLEAKEEQWKRQKQQLIDHLSETKACLEKHQLHLKTLSHANGTLSGSAAQLRDSYQALSCQLHEERLAKERASQEAERVREELEAERKKREELVSSQLSQWHRNLQTSTKNLSAALQNKIHRQQQELQWLRVTNTELTADLPSNIRLSEGVGGQCDLLHEVSTSGACHDQHQSHHQHRVGSNSGGSIWTEPCQCCHDCHRHHRQC
ncbi:uncharacterized protein LOC110983078 isoform X2 [Acanthaster planci]|uniref:Uncharacterized protein LOC110983078 isoform X2 n=1 Tax=Acanthaster planci TaxID=133434 RepID=A0A8B7YWJ7_ACAPL|nr:uncharacterized protein LOC110983078 isoform X2 [Acanthaster planci]